MTLGSIMAVHASAQQFPILSFDMYRDMMVNHPKARYAELAEKRGERELIKARGAFDPKLSGNYDYKFFKGTEYYNQTGVGIDVPLRAPIAIKSKYENADGAYFNPEETTPNGGLVSLGVAVPLGQGLITDRQRTDFRQAEAYVEFAKLERLRIRQELLLDAYSQYWNWWQAQRQYDIYTEWLSLSQERLRITKERFSLGDLASVDTLETFIQVQQRAQKTDALQAKAIKEKLSLLNYMWTSDETGRFNVIPDESTRPQTEMTFGISSDNTQLMESKANKIELYNPELRQFEPIFNQLRAEERWKKEAMKPIVNVQYNLMTEPTNGSASDIITSNNYKWGAQVAWPIFMRKAKSELELTRIKIEETSIDVELKRTATQNKALTIIRNIALFRNQLSTVRGNVSNMQLLLEAERDKFNSGESSVFLVNTREQQLFDLRLLEIELATQLKLAEINLQYLYGEL